MSLKIHGQCDLGMGDTGNFRCRHWHRYQRIGVDTDTDTGVDTGVMTPVSTPPMTPHLTPEKFPKWMNFPLFWSILRVLQANEANSDWGITKLYLSHVLAAYFITFLSTFFSLRNFSSKLLKYLAVCANPRRVSAKFGGFPPVSIPRLRCRHRLTPAKNRCRGRHRWHRHRCQPIPNWE